MDLPHDRCNWLIPNRVLIGAAPREEDLQNILDVGVNVFVNLQENNDINNKIKIYISL